ncbi:protein arginine N-methyltransferase 7-like [Ruditapes philippinarum]|uniref:protein arginine N-methyltransferase 7-like n=1 Tax=Ruditapes philippinarum TaxID=129788 RepID=UPI00295AF26E|nr:protein arginine N-methyltransferase 7-like [Ruditapes philippinarum]
MINNCRHIFRSRRLRMSTFVSKINRISGKMEWDFREDDYDYKQEIARSAYADMLHDTERNQLYYKGLEIAIAKLRQKGQAVHVLDIGTGTGLLSMMAAKLGADTVHACEAFKPMAECASKIIAQNGFADKIKLVPKRSTDLVVGEGKDLPRRANILVTEVFDTELIGEGAIGTFTHAHKELLEKDCIVIPSYANLYVQVVTSDLVRRWNQAEDIVVNDSRVTAPDEISNCGGAPSLHDLQLDQLPMDTFTVLTEPKRVFRFDFTGKTSLPFENTSILDCTMLNTGLVDAVFMWWDLEMDPDSEIILCCAPRWAHPTPNDMQWRDHWMQAIYYPYSRLSVAKGDIVKVISKHDEYSLWFDVAMETVKENCPEERPICRCGAHISYGRTRMGMINDPDRNKIFIDVLKKNISEESTCLCISDGSLLPLIAARLGAKHVYTIETNHMCKRVIKEFIKHNKLQDSVTVLDKLPEDIGETDIPEKIDIIIGEPVFQSSLLPWDNMCYWYLSQQFGNHLSDQCKVLPGKMTIYAIAVNYVDLWKIRADVGICEGFNIQEFDKIIQKSSEEVDENVEPHPLWEYPCTAAGNQQQVLNIDFTKSMTDTLPEDRCICLNVASKEPCNGVAMWVEFDFGNSHVITTGPKQPIKIGEKVVWDYHSKQGVHLFYNNQKTRCSSESSAIDVKVDFIPKEGKLDFKFSPKWL